MTTPQESTKALAGLAHWVRARATAPTALAPSATYVPDEAAHSWSVTSDASTFDDAWLETMRGYQAALSDMVANVPGACEAARARSVELAAHDLRPVGLLHGEQRI